METKSLDRECSRGEGTTAKSPPGDHNSPADRSIARPNKRLKTTDSSSAGDDEAEAQFDTQAEATHEGSPLVDEYAEEEHSDTAGDSSEVGHADSAKSTIGKGKAVAQHKTKSGTTDNSSDEGDEEEDLPTPKSAKAKAPKRTKPPRVARPDTEIQAFLDGIPGIASWTSTTGIHPDYCKIIEWLDKDKLEMKAIIPLWRQLPKRKSDGENPDKNIYKHYEKWAPKFYTEKNMVFVSRIDRRKYLAVEKAAGRVAPNPPKVKNAATKSENNGGMGKRSSTAPPHVQSNKIPTGAQAGRQLTASTNSQPQPTGSLTTMSLDQQLENLFAQVSPHTSSVDLFPEKKKKTQSKPITPAATTADQTSLLHGPSVEDVARYFANRNSTDVLHFKRSAGDSMLGHPSRPVLDLQCATQYSEYLGECVQDESELQLIEYDDSIQGGTIFRYVACVAPSLRKDLPTHDLVEVRKGELQATVIQWSMQELEELYVFALELRAWDVVDMVMDRMHAEVHRPTPRMLETEDGERKAFNILDISPSFLNHLSKCDAEGSHFFTDILIMKGQAGWDHMCKYGLDSWAPEIKQMLVKTLLDISTFPMVMVPGVECMCWEYHHHPAHDWVCYKEQDPAPPVVEVAPDSEPSPVSEYWQREIDLQAIAHQEGQVETLKLIAPGRPLTEAQQTSLSAARSTLKTLKHTRHKADKLVDITEIRMPSMSLTCYVEPEYIPYTPGLEDEDEDEGEYVATPVAPRPAEQPAIHGGFIWPKELGNTKTDNRRQQLGKMALLKRKLLEFKRAGIDVGDIGDIEDVGDVEMSDDGDEDGDESGSEDEDSSDEDE